jgi:hypothetical protein
MKKLLALSLVISAVCLGDGINLQNRSNPSFRVNAATNNVPGTPSGAVGSLVLSSVNNSQHLQICHESTSRIRVNWRAGNALSAPATADYQAIIPAAASGSFVCATWDDVQLLGTVYIWNDAGSTISSGLFYGGAW